MSELELRSAQVAAVSYPKRLVEVVVMPYEQEAQVDYHGRLITEICSRGAFDGIQRRANRVNVNLNHDREKPIGRAVSFHPSRDEGLVAEVRISKTVDGDDTLALADDGVLDVSAGFALTMDERGKPKKDAETWKGSSYRRLNDLWLHHIAFVPEPAYQGARVLAVRDASKTSEGFSADRTPNLDEVRAWQLEQQYNLIRQH